jgi:phosphocarrier protein HPr
MIQQTVTINKKTGLSARPVNQLVQTASCYISDIFLIHNGRRVNAKSVLGILSLAIPKQSEITLEAEGEDENEALQEVINTLEKLE